MRKENPVPVMESRLYIYIIFARIFMRIHDSPPANGSVMRDFYVRKTSDYTVFAWKIKVAEGKQVKINGDILR